MSERSRSAERLARLAAMLGRPVEDLFTGSLAEARTARFGELMQLWEVIESEAGLDAVLTCAREAVATQAVPMERAAE